MYNAFLNNSYIYVGSYVMGKGSACREQHSLKQNRTICYDML